MVSNRLITMAFVGYHGYSPLYLTYAPLGSLGQVELASISSEPQALLHHSAPADTLAKPWVEGAEIRASGRARRLPLVLVSGVHLLCQVAWWLPAIPLALCLVVVSI